MRHFWDGKEQKEKSKGGYFPPNFRLIFSGETSYIAPLLFAVFFLLFVLHSMRP